MSHALAWPEAREAAYRLGTEAPTGVEGVALPDAVGRTLAANLVAEAALPGFDTSAMDGWAVSGEGPWSVVGESLAGRPWEGEFDSGGAAQAIRIATGARVPAGARAIVRREHGALDADGRVSASLPSEGRDLRRAGEECAVGDILARKGAVSGPALVGLAAAIGRDDLQVRVAPRVSLAIFGDELALTGAPGPASVRDSLGPQVPGWLRLLGAGPVTVSHAADTLDDHIAAISSAVAVADLVVTTGGTAAGPVDYVHAAITGLGGVYIADSVAVRPGHPMVLARLERGGRAVPILALPGNPQSAVVAIMSLGWPLLAGMLGRDVPRLGLARLSEEWSAPTGEHRLVAGARGDSGAFIASAHLGSAMLRGLADAEGFAIVPPGGAAAGDDVEWLPLPNPHRAMGGAR